MAEDPISQDQHRADMTELRSKLKEEIAGIRQEFGRHETRLLSLENRMRTTYVTLAVVVLRVASQLFYTLLRFGFKSPTP